MGSFGISEVIWLKYVCVIPFLGTAQINTEYGIFSLPAMEPNESLPWERAGLRNDRGNEQVRGKNL